MKSLDEASHGYGYGLASPPFMPPRIYPTRPRYIIPHVPSHVPSHVPLHARTGMDKSPEELRQLMHDADPDGSGEVDFEEFVTVLRKQMKEGGGGLLSAFSGVSSLLGMLNPLSWFAPPPPPPPPPEPRSPVRAYGGGVWTALPEGRSTPRSEGGGQRAYRQRRTSRETPHEGMQRSVVV